MWGQLLDHQIGDPILKQILKVMQGVAVQEVLPVAAAFPAVEKNELARIVGAGVDVKTQTVLLVEYPLGEAQKTFAHAGAVGRVEIKGRHNGDGHLKAFADSLQTAVMSQACVGKVYLTVKVHPIAGRKAGVF